MSNKTVTRYPFEPLEQAVGAETILNMASLIGVTPRSVHRWKKQGSIPERSADRIATRIQSHVACIWPNEYWAHASGDNQ